MSYKLKVSFDQMRSALLIPFSKGVSKAMSNNPYFPEPWQGCPTTLAQLDVAILNVENADLAAKTGDHQKVAERPVHHKHLCSRLYNVANFVEMTANGDAAILRSSGFEVRKPAARGKAVVHLDIPDLSVVYGETSGTMIAKAKSVRGAKSYELQVCTGDPTVEGNWSHQAFSPYCSGIIVQNLEPGKYYSFRLRAIGGKTSSAWSLTVTKMTL